MVNFVLMRLLPVSFALMACVLVSACNSSSNQTSDTQTVTQNENVDTSWTDVGGGVKLRNNAVVQKQLEGRIFARNYEQEIGDGAKNSIEYSMGLCKQGKMTTHEKTTPIVANKKETPTEVYDEGDWQAMEDQKGNLYIRINMKKAGKGFLNFEIKGKDLLLKNGENAEIFSEQAGGC